jgi:hypothetical protein
MGGLGSHGFGLMVNLVHIVIRVLHRDLYWGCKIRQDWLGERLALVRWRLELGEIGGGESANCYDCSEA